MFTLSSTDCMDCQTLDTMRHVRLRRSCLILLKICSIGNDFYRSRYTGPIPGH